MPSWSPEKTWTAGETVEASELNTYLRDNAEYLKGVTDAIAYYAVRATRAATQSLTTSTYTDISWTAESFDIGSWITVTSTTFTVPAATIPSGYTTIALRVSMAGRFAANATGSRVLRVLKDGAFWGGVVTTATGAADTTDMAFTDVMTAQAGTLIKFQAWQSSGGNLNVDQLVGIIERAGVVS